MLINNFNRETYDQPGSRWLGREVFYCNGTNTLKKTQTSQTIFELNFPVHNCICWCNWCWEAINTCDPSELRRSHSYCSRLKGTVWVASLLSWIWQTFVTHLALSWANSVFWQKPHAQQKASHSIWQSWRIRDSTVSLGSLCKGFIIFTIKCMCHFCSCITFQFLVFSHAFLFNTKEPGFGTCEGSNTS